MNDKDSVSLHRAVKDAIDLSRGKNPRLRAALASVNDSLEALCATLQEKAASTEPAGAHAAVLVVSRDLIATALTELSEDGDADTKAVTLALATLHNRLVAALEACVVRAG